MADHVALIDVSSEQPRDHHDAVINPFEENAENVPNNGCTYRCNEFLYDHWVIAIILRLLISTAIVLALCCIPSGIAIANIQRNIIHGQWDATPSYLTENNYKTSYVTFDDTYMHYVASYLNGHIAVDMMVKYELSVIGSEWPKFSSIWLIFGDPSFINVELSLSDDIYPANGVNKATVALPINSIIKVNINDLYMSIMPEPNNMQDNPKPYYTAKRQ